jgi:FkbM family methyltransferase
MPSRGDVKRSIAHRMATFSDAKSSAIIDRVSRDVVGDVDVRLPEFQGIFRLGAQSHILHRILRSGFYEPELAQIAVDLVKGDAIDVGANVGFYSVLMAKGFPGARVLSVEPTHAALRRLKHNLDVNGVAQQAIVYEGIVGMDAGTSHLTVVDGLEEYSTIGGVAHPSATGKLSSVVEVSRSTIDSLVEEHALKPTFLKVDVEGFEMEVFRGALKTLETYRPAILSELTDPLLRRNGTSSVEVVQLLQDIGYEVLDPLDVRRQPARREFGDILAIPRSSSYRPRSGVQR